MEDQYSDTVTKSFFARFWWTGLIIVLLIVGFIIFVKMSDNQDDKKIGPATSGSLVQEIKTEELKWPDASAKYITAVPLDLTQIQSISRYRSCSGHDSSGYSFDQVLESDRSMKHYIYPVQAFQGTIDKVKAFAPFDGTVSSIELEKDKVGKRPQNGNTIKFKTPADTNVEFIFDHIYFDKDFKVGDTILAGDLVGFGAVPEKINSFDILLSGSVYIDHEDAMVLGSAFDHMSDSVLAEFAKYGITPKNTKFSKDYRDQNPCNYASGSSIDDPNSDKNWIQLLR